MGCMSLSLGSNVRYTALHVLSDLGTITDKSSEEGVI